MFGGEPIQEELLLKPHILDEDKLKASKEYKEALKKLWQSTKYVKALAINVHKKLSGLKLEQIKRLYLGEREEKPKLFSQTPSFASMLQLYSSSKKEDSHVFCMLCCGFIDRLVGDVAFFTAYKSSGGKTSETKVSLSTKLRDLLDSKIVQNLLGEDLVFLLRVFIGVPMGINAKNLSLHGFLTTEQFEPPYSSLAMCLIFTIDSFLSKKLGIVDRELFMKETRWMKCIDKYLEEIPCQEIPNGNFFSLFLFPDFFIIFLFAQSRLERRKSAARSLQTV